MRPVFHATIPIVMVATTDPVKNGLVTNLARPEGNLAGLASSTPQLIAKRVELLKELLPRLARFAAFTVRDERRHLSGPRKGERDACGHKTGYHMTSVSDERS
jgi:putative tryptophan/tyrosine transport system substrate-binding protein